MPQAADGRSVPTPRAEATEGTVAVEDPLSGDVRELLSAHLSFCHAETPPQDVHALEISELEAPSVTLFSFRTRGRLLGVGALKVIDEEHAEVKSMHTERSARRTGVASTLLDHLISVARQRGYHRLSLETGNIEAFAPARALYEKAGFTTCGPFAAYTDSPNSIYMTIEL